MLRGWGLGGGRPSNPDIEPVEPLAMPEQPEAKSDGKSGSSRYETGFDPTALERGVCLLLGFVCLLASIVLCIPRSAMHM